MRVADVLEQAVATAGHAGERLHRLLDDVRAGVVETVLRFTRLKEHVGILGGATQHRPIGRQPAAAVRIH